mmetsp:Transcript_21329/g.33008  ORF Transcript_21329/g.33008 Transcript_21329/m.33008 type:complete len:212 (-) Transcript_21329:546-1181(-)
MINELGAVTLLRFKVLLQTSHTDHHFEEEGEEHGHLPEGLLHHSEEHQDHECFRERDHVACTDISGEHHAAQDGREEVHGGDEEGVDDGQLLEDFDLFRSAVLDLSLELVGPPVELELLDIAQGLSSRVHSAVLLLHDYGHEILGPEAKDCCNDESNEEDSHSRQIGKAQSIEEHEEAVGQDHWHLEDVRHLEAEPHQLLSVDLNEVHNLA